MCSEKDRIQKKGDLESPLCCYGGNESSFIHEIKYFTRRPPSWGSADTTNISANDRVVQIAVRDQLDTTALLRSLKTLLVENKMRAWIDYEKDPEDNKDYVVIRVAFFQKNEESAKHFLKKMAMYIEDRATPDKKIGEYHNFLKEAGVSLKEISDLKDIQNYQI